MLEDRHYMRPDYRPRSAVWDLPVTYLLMIVLTVVFALQKINDVYFHSGVFESLELTRDALRHGYVWQLLTFQFLHAGLTHLLFNLFGIWMFGRIVEERLGRVGFLKLYFLSGITGGILQAALAWVIPAYFGGHTVGASAGIFGLVAAYTLLDPEGVILLFMILPMKARHLLYLETGIAAFFTLVPSEPGVAHAAHLGGILFTVAWFKLGMNNSARSWSDWNPLHRKWRRERMIKAATVRPVRFRRPAQPAAPAELPSEEFISKEVDPILDKISAHGIQSLTDRERQILQAARAKMSRR